MVSICNPLGQEVHKEQVRDAKTTLNLSRLQSGLYLVQAGTEKPVRVILSE